MIVGVVKIGCVAVAGISGAWLWTASDSFVRPSRARRRMAWIMAVASVAVFMAVNLAD